MSFKTIFPALLLLALGSCQAKSPQTASKSVLPSKPLISGRGQERVVGNMLKSALETYHYRGIKIDDDVSHKAFDEYLKKVDYSKQFLMAEDIQQLRQYRSLMDDQMTSGDHKLVELSMALYEKRAKQAEKLRQKIFKKQFVFTRDESLELDPKKREYAKTSADWEDYWRKLYKHTVLLRYLSMLDEQKGPETPEDKDKKAKGQAKKKDKGKTLSDKEMRTKAHTTVAEKYSDFFRRRLKDERADYLEKFYNSISGVFDPHTSYLPPKRKEDFDIDISGQLEGIGAVLQENGPYIKVMRIVPGGAAWRQKDLEVDDIILMVGEGKGDPVDLVDMRVDDAVRYIRGKKGTEVRLTVKKADGTRKVIPIVRDVIQMEAAFAKSSVLKHQDLKAKIGYIQLPKFYRDFNDPKRNCSRDVKIEIERLNKHKVDGIILDLRNNGGGALSDAQEISGLFISSGPIVQTKNYAQQIEVLSDDDGKISYDKPLIVMTNRFSASASEILAGALQDYQRAIIVGGEHTHGKGTVQAVIPLNTGIMGQLLGRKMGALKVTIQKFYRISGISTQYLGITPDIVIPDSLAYVGNREKDLEYSLPGGSVKKRTYKKWGRHPYRLKELQKQSAQRANQNPRFQKLRRSLSYLKARNEDTVVSLSLKKVIAEEEENEKMSRSLRQEEKSQKIAVSRFKESIERHEKIAKMDKARWQKDFAQKREEWVSGIQRDPEIEEAIFIMGDMLGQLQGKKLLTTKATKTTRVAPAK